MIEVYLKAEITFSLKGLIERHFRVKQDNEHNGWKGGKYEGLERDSAQHVYRVWKEDLENLGRDCA